jgi:hypothetical protein
MALTPWANHPVPRLTTEGAAAGQKEEVLVTASINPTRPDTYQGERPTSGAELSITLGPSQADDTTKGNVPPDQARHLIAIFVILGAISSFVAAVAALRSDPASAVPVAAFAALTFNLAAAVVIAVRGYTRVRRKRNRSRTPKSPPHQADT